MLQIHAYHFRYTFFMPNYEQHPMRVLRRRYGLEMVELARLAGVSRATVSQIEEGRTKKPNIKVVKVLSNYSGISPNTILDKVREWQETPSEEILPPRYRGLLSLTPDAVLDLYPSFEIWRKEISETPTHFASVLRINRLTVAKYERGQFVGGMPDTLAHALITRLGISDEYLSVLETLPPCLKK